MPAFKRKLTAQPGKFANSGYSLSDPELKPEVDKIRERLATDPKFARQLLRSAGIIDGKGKLTKPFGG